MSIFKLPKQFTPGFSTKEKPTIPVEIDKSHWLVTPPVQSASTAYGQGLKSVFIFGFGFRDLVKNGIAEDGYTLVSDGGGFEATLGPDYIDCTNSGSVINFNNDYTLAVNGTAFTQSITISALVDYPLAQSLSGIIGDSNPLQYNGTTLSFNGGSITHDPSTLTGRHRVTVTSSIVSTVESVRFFIDGVLIGSTSSTAFPSLIVIKGIGNGNVVLRKDRGVKLYDFFLWEGYALSDEAVLEHAQNPYQILKPSIPAVYFPSGEEAGGVTGTGTPQATAATSTGTAERTVTGSGAPAATTATSTGTGTVGSEITGTGTAQTDTATANGSGLRIITGSGSPTASTAISSGSGLRLVTGSGTPQAETATSTGSGTVGNAVIGSGSPQATTATSNGAGLRLITGSGATQATTAISTASGEVSGAITGSGTPQSTTATSSGVALRVITGSGAVQATTATASGTDADGTTIHPNRVYTVEAENRIYTVEAEDRVYVA